jgi:ABC-2 type transport system ATP-binding protein
MINPFVKRESAQEDPTELDQNSPFPFKKNPFKSPNSSSQIPPNTQSNDTIIVDHLSIQFGSKKIVKDVSFRVRLGEINGFLGISGAGKTTIIRVLTCQIAKKHWTGNVIINGLDLAKKRNHTKILGQIGYVPQLEELNLYYDLSPLENMCIFGATFGFSRAESKRRAKELFAILEIPEDTWEGPLDKMSGGEKKRVSMAIGLINFPQILFLDEPTTGVDASKRFDILNYLKKLNQTLHTTMIIITHDLEAANICDTVAILKNGMLIEYGTPQELIKTLPSAGEILRLRIPDLNNQTLEYLRNLDEVAIAIRVGSNLVEVLLNDISTQLKRFIEKMLQKKLELQEISRTQVSFKRYFQLRIQSTIYS